MDIAKNLIVTGGEGAGGVSVEEGGVKHMVTKELMLDEHMVQHPDDVL